MVNQVNSPSDLIEKGVNSEGQSFQTGAIMNALPAPVMRRSMENKNLLAQKGSMYIGTGNVYKVVDSVGGFDYNTAETIALNPPTEAGTYVLTCVVTMKNGNPVANVNWVKQN